MQEQEITARQDTRASRPIGLRWDGTITAGNLLTSIALGATLLIWGVRLEDRLDKEQALRATLEERMDRYVVQQRDNDRDIKFSLHRLDDKITSLLISTATRAAAKPATDSGAPER